MATSIRDLLTALDDASAREPADPADAVGALEQTGRILERLRANGVVAERHPTHDAAIRRLAESCDEAARTFAAHPGRLSDLLGVTDDAIGCTRGNLNTDERWHIATALATSARRWAHHVATSGPYESVPQLLGVTDRSRELISVAARYPADASRLDGLDAPIPCATLPHSLSAAEVVAESIAQLVASARQVDRSPMTVRQMIGTARAGEIVAIVAAAMSHRQSDVEAIEPRRAVVCWRTVREELSRFTDEPKRTQARSDPILLSAIRIQDAARHVLTTMADEAYRSQAADVHAIERAVSVLPMLAGALEDQILRPVTRFVAGGPHPLHEGRVAEWLLRKPFVATPHDVQPATAALREATTASRRLSAKLEPAAQRGRRDRVTLELTMTISV